MSSSTLDPDNMNRPDRKLGKGHGTSALGPSDTSDNGSDLAGAPGMAQQVGLGLDTGTTSDPEDNTAGWSAGPDVGDADLSSDSDATGTGETATAGRDTVVIAGQDIDIDRVDSINADEDEDIDGSARLGSDADEDQKGHPRRLTPADRDARGPRPA